jgi:glycine betaine/proline transport system permease protein
MATSSRFPDWGTPLRDATNAAVDYLVVNFGDAFEAFSNSLLGVLLAIEQLLRGAAPWMILLATAALALAAIRHCLFALASTAGMWLIGALGQWDQAMQTMALVLL